MSEILKILDKARSRLEAASFLLDHGFLNDSLNRSYYAAFAAVTMVHSLEGNSFNSHQQALGNFNKEYVATGIFDKKLGKALYTLFNDRQLADYDTTVDFTSESAVKSFQAAKLIVDECEKFCRGKYPELFNDKKSKF